ncbi:MAG: dehydratase [Sulfobacillus thermosulfidooxidans]|uniref:Dehydratase n=1 Tax=Sulfobacillus thermosulfidooxidans TaxID=28034 RepID=A0A2T2X620_SULTH|nr:MAG: dehydratase [Sulfobacillus thermosulfidooxidans]
MFDRNFESFNLGDTYISSSRTIQPEDIDIFAEWSGDHYPLHTDETYAKSTRYGERILHGLGTLSISFGLIPLKAPEVIALYGLDHVRFLRPVTIGTAIHVRLVCTNLRHHEQGGLVQVHMTTEDHDGNPLMSAEITMLMRRQS